MDYQKSVFSARAIRTPLTELTQENRNKRVYNIPISMLTSLCISYGTSFSQNYGWESPVGRLVTLNQVSLLNPHQGSYKIGSTGFIYERINQKDLYSQAKKLKPVKLLERFPMKYITNLKNRSYQVGRSLFELDGMEGFGNGIIEEYRTAYHPNPKPLNKFTYTFTKPVPLSDYKK